MSKPKKFVVKLTDDDVRYLKKLRKKKSTSQTIANCCNILLAMDENHPPAKTYDQSFPLQIISKCILTK